MSPIPSPETQPDWVLDQEWIERYSKGGYRPTVVGDLLHDGRFRIVGKLGYGEQSTVWLASDAQNGGVCVAIKIFKANNSKYNATMGEYPALLRLNDAAGRDHPGRECVPRLIDGFWAESRYGSHFCIVSELLATNVSGVLARHFPDRLPEPVLKGVLYDVLLALDYCHSVCGIIHTDIKVSNVASCASLSHDGTPLTIAVPVPVTYDVRAADGSTVTYTQPMDFADVLPDSDNLEGWKDVGFTLIDFGAAHVCEGANAWDEFDDLEISSMAGRSPEAWVGAPWNAATDIWSAGMLMYQLCTGYTLLPDGCGHQLCPLVIRAVCGAFPPALLKDGYQSESWFDPETGDLCPKLRHLEGCFKNRGLREELRQAHEEVRLSEAATDVLVRMLMVDPERRPTAQELLGHAWFEEIRQVAAQ